MHDVVSLIIIFISYVHEKSVALILVFLCTVCLCFMKCLLR